VGSNEKNKTISKTIMIVNELGLHARAAAQIAKFAQLASAKVWISKDEEKVDAASIIDILTLVGTKGSQVTLTVDDPVDIYILNKIEELFKNKFGE
jgi:phosphocarrier protein